MGTNHPSLHYIDEGKLAPTGDHSNCERFWANIKSYQAGKGYGPNSAYNFAVCNEHGIIMQGMGWDVSSNANGGENGVWYNEGSRALVMLVGSDDVLSPQLKGAVAAWTQEAYSRGMVPPLMAHSDFVQTSCCGDNGRALVAQINGGVVAPNEGEFDMGQMEDIAQWEQDTRAIILNALVGDAWKDGSQGILGKWMQDQSKLVVGAVSTTITNAVKAIPAGPNGQVNKADVVAAVEEALNKVHLTTK